MNFIEVLFTRSDIVLFIIQFLQTTKNHPEGWFFEYILGVLTNF